MKIVSEDKAFITKDNYKLYTLQDLIIWLYNTDENTFRFHVNDKENHIYNWIKDVFGLNDLAEKIKNSKDRFEIINKIEEYLSKLDYEKYKDKEEAIYSFILSIKK